VEGGNNLVAKPCSSDYSGGLETLREFFTQGSARITAAGEANQRPWVGQASRRGMRRSWRLRAGGGVGEQRRMLEQFRPWRCAAAHRNFAIGIPGSAFLLHAGHRRRADNFNHGHGRGSVAVSDQPGQLLAHHRSLEPPMSGILTPQCQGACHSSRQNPQTNRISRRVAALAVEDRSGPIAASVFEGQRVVGASPVSTA